MSEKILDDQLVADEPIEIVEEPESTESVESEKTEPVDAETSKMSKHDLAVGKIEQAKYQSQNIQDMMAECMHNIDLDMEEFNLEKRKLYAEAIDPIETILDDLGVDHVVHGEVTDSSVELKDLDDAKVEISEISSGRVKGAFFAILSAIVLLVGWCYAATTSLGLSFVPQNGPDMEKLNKVLEWTSTQIGQGANANIGATLLIVTLLVLMFVVYSIVVHVRASNNLKIADSIESEVDTYCTNKEECKEKMAVVREHIQKSSTIINDYRVILEELYFGLKRAVHIEKHDSFGDLHAKTKAEILTIKELIGEIESLTDTPIAKYGVLTDDVIDRIVSAQEMISSYIKKIYS